MNELEKWALLKAWLADQNAALAWRQENLNLSGLGPQQQDCWLINGHQVLILFWASSWEIYTASPLLGVIPDEAKLYDAQARLPR